MTQYQLTDYSVIEASGVDAETFLQGQITADITSIAENPIPLTAYCNREGRIISSFFIKKHPSKHYYLLLPHTMLSITLNRLKKFAVFSKIQLKDVTDQFTITAEVNPAVTAITFELAPVTQQYAVTINVAWQALLINQCIAMINPTTSEKLLPHEVNYPALGAVSFKKGCYIGQEIIARMHYKAKLKYKLYTVTIETTLLPTIYANILQGTQTVGHIIDVLSQNNFLHLLIVADMHYQDQSVCIEHQPELIFCYQ